MAQNRGVGSPTHHGDDFRTSCFTVIGILSNHGQGKFVSDEEKIAVLHIINQMFNNATGSEPIMTTPHLDFINDGVTQTTRSEPRNDSQIALYDQENDLEYSGEELSEAEVETIGEKTSEQLPVSGEKRKRKDSETIETVTTTTISKVDASNDEENEKGPETKKVRKKRQPTVAGQMTKAMMSTTADIQAALVAAGVCPSFGRGHNTLRPISDGEEKVVIAKVSNDNTSVTVTINKQKTFKLQNSGLFPVKKKEQTNDNQDAQVSQNQPQIN